MINIATWNINSVNARLPALLAYLNEKQPDFMLLQEIKCQNDNFPAEEIAKAGYHAIVSGQKSYNGVAILSKEELLNPLYALPEVPQSDTPQARFVQGETKDGLKIISVYVPNGNPPLKDPTSKEKLYYKLAWQDALTAYAKKLLAENASFIIGGDFNVIINDADVYNPEAYRTNALMVPEVRQKMQDLHNLGLVNAFKTFHPEGGNYSFWDYTMKAWQRNMGMLIDDILLSPDLAPRLQESFIDKPMRGIEKASDHVPLWAVLG